jgi:aryl-alcohol dehydrogenase
MRIKAALVEAPSAAFTFETLELDEPRDEEVLVRIVATGLCQTDLHVRDQHYPVPLPIVLGHEGAGVVERVGASVGGVEPGDHVVLSFPSCGHCRPCRTGHNAYCESGFSLCFGGSRPDGSSPLHRLDGAAPSGDVHGSFFAQSSFASHALATASNVVKVSRDVPLDLLGPLGCGFQTGAGAVLNSLKVRAGASIAILGVGAVGLAAVMAARIAGASRIIAVDINAQRLALAAELGATHTINARTEDVAARTAAITGAGVDYSLEITGLPKMLRMAVDLLAPLGIAALIGGAPAGAEATIDMNGLLGGRTVRGIAQGDSIPQIFIPTLIDMHRQGVFPFDRLIRFYDFEDINAAVEDTRRGDTIKAVLRIGSA